MYINKVGRSSGQEEIENTYQVGSGGYDGTWYGSTFVSNNTTIVYGYPAGVLNKCFMTWAGINLPAGSVILEAVVSLYIESISSIAGGVLSFADAADPANPTSASEADALTPTTNNVACNPASTGWQTYDVKTIVEELLASYSSYNSKKMIGLITVSSPGPYYATVRAYEYSGNTYGPKLYLKYLV